MRLERLKYRASLAPVGGVTLYAYHPLVKDLRHAFVFSLKTGDYETIQDLVIPAYRATRLTNAGLLFMRPSVGLGGLGTTCSGASVGTTGFSGWHSGTSGSNWLCRVREGAKAMTVYVRATNPLDRYNWDAVFNTSGIAKVSYPTADDGFGGANTSISPWAVFYYDDGSTIKWQGILRTGSTNFTRDVTSNGRGKRQNFAMTYDGATQKVYSDGSLVDSQAVTGNLAVTGAFGVNVTKYWSIIGNGRDTNIGSRFAWFGICHYILVWERALTPAELRWLEVEPYTFISQPTKVSYFLLSTSTPLTLSKADSVNNLADSAALSMVQAANLAISKGDQLSFNDGISITGPPPNYFLLLGDSLANLQDSPQTVIGLFNAFTDSVNNLVDSLAKMVGIPVQAFDSQQFNWADAISISEQSPLNLTPADSINNYLDFVVRVLGNVRIDISVSDTINNLSDALRMYFVLRKTAEDNLTFSDALQMRFTHLMRIAEAMQALGEAVQFDVQTKPRFSDSINSLSDSVSLALSANLTLTRSDQLSFSDAVSILLSGNYNPLGGTERIRRYLGDTQDS